MGSATYQVRGLVLKRTKLGETDVICTILAEDGSQVKAVAKGARKPSSVFTSRLELFSACDLLLAKGKNLDIIKEARLVEAHAELRSNLELTEVASPMVELIERATLASLENVQLYPLTMKALDYLEKAFRIDSSHMLPHAHLLLLCGAHLIKTVSILGFKPQLISCIGCGDSSVVSKAITLGNSVPFSYFDGGVVCAHCQQEFETLYLNPLVLNWSSYLLYSTFEEIVIMDVPSSIQIEILRFLQAWIKEHIGYSLKSLTYLFSYGFLDEV